MTDKFPSLHHVCLVPTLFFVGSPAASLLRCSVPARSDGHTSFSHPRSQSPCLRLRPPLWLTRIALSSPPLAHGVPGAGTSLLWGACTALHPLAVCTHLSAHPLATCPSPPPPGTGRASHPLRRRAPGGREVARGGGCQSVRLLHNGIILDHILVPCFE